MEISRNSNFLEKERCISRFDASLAGIAANIAVSSIRREREREKERVESRLDGKST